LKNDTEYDIFSIKQLQLHVLCTFPRFGESGFGETGLNRASDQRSEGCGFEAY